MGGPTMGWILKGFSHRSAKMWHCRVLEERWDPQALALPHRVKDDSFPPTLEPVCSWGCFGALWEALTLARGDHRSWAGSSWPFVWLLRKAAVIAMPQLQPSPKMKDHRQSYKSWEQVWGFACVCGYSTRGVIPTWTSCLHVSRGGHGAQPLAGTCV